MHRLIVLSIIVGGVIVGLWAQQTHARATKSITCMALQRVLANMVVMATEGGCTLGSTAPLPIHVDVWRIGENETSESAKRAMQGEDPKLRGLTFGEVKSDELGKEAFIALSNLGDFATQRDTIWSELKNSDAAPGEYEYIYVGERLINVLSGKCRASFVAEVRRDALAPDVGEVESRFAGTQKEVEKIVGSLASVPECQSTVPSPTPGVVGIPPPPPSKTVSGILTENMKRKQLDALKKKWGDAAKIGPRITDVPKKPREHGLFVDPKEGAIPWSGIPKQPCRPPPPIKCIRSGSTITETFQINPTLAKKIVEYVELALAAQEEAKLTKGSISPKLKKKLEADGKRICAAAVYFALDPNLRLATFVENLKKNFDRLLLPEGGAFSFSGNSVTIGIDILPKKGQKAMQHIDLSFSKDGDIYISTFGWSCSF